MAEFPASAELSITLASGETDRIRRQIERELSDINIGGSAAPTGADGGGVGGGTASTAAILSIQKKTLSAQQASADFDEERNEILKDIRDDLAGGAGGGGGGVGSIATFEAGRRLGGGGRILSAIGALGGRRAFFPGMFGKGSTGRPGELGPGPDSAGGQFIQEFLTQSGLATPTPNKPGALDLTASDIVGEPLDLGVGDIFGDISITKEDILNTIFGGGGGDNTQETTTTTTSGQGAFPTDPPSSFTSPFETHGRPPRPDCGPRKRAVWSPFNRAWRCVETSSPDRGSTGFVPRTF